MVRSKKADDGYSLFEGTREKVVFGGKEYEVYFKVMSIPASNYINATFRIVYIQYV